MRNTSRSCDGDARAYRPSAFNRSRASAMKGAFSGLRRAMVERRAKSSLEDNLKLLKLRLERR